MFQVIVWDWGLKEKEGISAQSVRVIGENKKTKQNPVKRLFCKTTKWQAEHPDGVEEAELLVENIIWNPELSGVSVGCLKVF